MTDLIAVDFSATIKLFPKDIDDAEGDVMQAVQNVIGGTGAECLFCVAKADLPEQPDA